MREQDRLFKILFSSSDYIGHGYKGNTAVNPQPIKSSEFFCINPLHPNMDYYTSNDGEVLVKRGRRRSDLNVTKFINFLFEIDSMPLDEQLNILNKIEEKGIKWASIVYSGGKSYHAIISLEESINNDQHTKEGILHYKHVWKALALELSKLAGFSTNVFDTACCNPSRLSRFPGYTCKNRKRQDVIKYGKISKNEQIMGLIKDSLPDKKSIKIAPIKGNTSETVDQVRMMVPAELFNRLRFPKTWAQGAAGNYPHLLKLILWLIDSTGATKEASTAYLEKYTFPTLRELGYPHEKCIKAINDAYTMKGL